MAKPASAAMLAAVVVQYLLAALVYFTTRRLDLRNPEQHRVEVIVPAAGFVGMLDYLSERGDTPRAD